MSTTQKVYLVTGGNSGLGYQCCLALAKQENTHVIVAGRSPNRINDAIAAIQREAAPTSTVESGIVNLGSLKSVCSYANDLISRNVQLTAIVCNAGVQVDNLSYTEDGFETTIGINHVGHFLFVKLLRERAQRVVVVGSECHDREAGPDGSPTMTTDNVVDTAYGRNGAFDGQSAYSNSKLCNLVFVKEFVRRFPDGPEILAYTPGLTPDTQLFREHPEMVKHFSSDRISTSEYSGKYLARTASDVSWAANGWSNGEYIRIDGVGKPSAQACDPVLGAELWNNSEEWVKSFTT